MSEISRVFRSEQIKSKRTLALYLSVIGPVLALAMSLFSLALVDGLAKGKGIAIWQAYLQPSLHIWFSFVMPMVVTLQAAQASQLEHANQKWKHLLSLPLTRASIFLGKWLWLLALFIASNMLLSVSVLAVCVFSGWAKTSDGSLAQAVSYVAGQMTIGILCSLFLISVQYVASVRLASFVAAISMGLVGTIIGVFGSGVVPKLMSIIPWAMPGVSVSGEGMATGIIVSVSIIGSACAMTAGAIEFRRRQVHS